jgi:hypothetical protein
LKLDPATFWQDFFGDVVCALCLCGSGGISKTVQLSCLIS